MTTEQIIGLSLALFVMCFGLAGSVLPGIPGTPLVVLAAVAHRLYFGATSASNTARDARRSVRRLRLATPSDFVGRMIDTIGRLRLRNGIKNFVGMRGSLVGAYKFKFCGLRHRAIYNFVPLKSQFLMQAVTDYSLNR